MQSLDNKKIIALQENHDLFISSLMLLLDILCKQNYTNAFKLLKELDTKIDIDRKSSIIKKVFMLIDIYFDLLKSNDTKLFNLYTKQNGKILKVTVIPGIDINVVWNKLNADDHNKIWQYLKCMYIASSSMVNNSGNENNIVNLEKINELKSQLNIQNKQIYDEFWNKFPKNTLVTKQIEFNPYIGVGENHNQYGVNDLLSGPKTLPHQISPDDGVTKLLGIDKLLNLEELSKQLKNITKEQIDQAKNGIVSMLGNDIDKDTSEMIDLMLNHITDELKKEDISDDPISNLTKIAECVATKMTPKIDPKKVDMNKVWNSTRNIANKCCDKDGKPLFSGPNNPLSMVTNLMEKQIVGMQKRGIDPNKKMSEEEYTKECQNILKDIGLPNVSVDQLKNLNLNQLLGDINKPVKK